ncbi:uncharacterized protein BT62DRAFT_921521 [Guyanagaster necrorhizus]|uniref:Uncharacterized protein n=1 Tax=Guyanagaster necrorhizus TaxID=856835 RepID=A0A9P8APZ6_9AGAR|nr:uncharacterized protein BT62DRAFT_921521 [Guyanagaster necrorhizus MCA 3950]KAG7443853.1 hypothetical protein BT62DRAFT_921521 [Guyanagaster necrorhizus MCA 3950]
MCIENALMDVVYSSHQIPFEVVHVDARCQGYADLCHYSYQFLMQNCGAYTARRFLMPWPVSHRDDSQNQADEHKKTVYVRILVAGWNVTIIQGDDNAGHPFSAQFSSPYGEYHDTTKEELQDALSVIYDQLKCSKSWWILEIIPMAFRQQKENEEWVSWFGAKFGPRKIPMRSRVKVHRIVRQSLIPFQHNHNETTNALLGSVMVVIRMVDKLVLVGRAAK